MLDACSEACRRCAENASNTPNITSTCAVGPRHATLRTAPLPRLLPPPRLEPVRPEPKAAVQGFRRVGPAGIEPATLGLKSRPKPASPSVPETLPLVMRRSGSFDSEQLVATGCPVLPPVAPVASVTLVRGSRWRSRSLAPTAVSTARAPRRSTRAEVLGEGRVAAVVKSRSCSISTASRLRDGLTSFPPLSPSAPGSRAVVRRRPASASRSRAPAPSAASRPRP